MERAVRLKVSGIVQGVFFRQSTQAKARELGISGWVRNCDDGSVETVAEGEEVLINEFINWCRRGPEHAVVTNVQVTWIDAGNKIGFEIIRG